VLLDTKESGEDPFNEIENILSWEDFTKSITETEKLGQVENFDSYAFLAKSYNQLRRYTPMLLDMLDIGSVPTANDIQSGVQIIKHLNETKGRKVPDDAPDSFIRKRWKDFVFTDQGTDRCFYEMAVLSELKNGLRSGDIWVEGSRQFKIFDEYLLPVDKYNELLLEKSLGLPIELNFDIFIEDKLNALTNSLKTVEGLAESNDLPDATFSNKGRLSITPLDNAVPPEADAFINKIYDLLPRVKITELLVEVDSWTNFSSEFKHLKSNDPTKEIQPLLTTILAGALNFGLRKMSESCPGSTYNKLSWIQAWYIRDETYSKALSVIINAQAAQPFSTWWGDGSTSSSDGQNFKTGGRGSFTGQVNLRHGQTPGMQIYTHLSGQYAPFHSRPISAAVRDAPFVLDGLLYHESDIRIKEHYIDTHGFTDHVFAIMHLLGFKFSPRIRDLADKRLYIYGNVDDYPTLSPMIGGNININKIRDHWQEILRFASSIKHGTVTASLILRKLGNYPRQNGLAVAIRELGRIERTLFALEWMQSVDLRRRVQIGLNKGEGKNSLSRAVFFNRLGEIRDQSYESQRYRASALNLVVAAIILWNTV
jgi:TnpA family transposase